MHFPEIIEIINVLDPPKRIRKLSNAEAFKEICHVLKTGIQWRHLEPKNGTRHGVYKRFRKWVNDEVFNKAWKLILERYSKRKLDKDALWFKELFIDCTLIKNIYGTECLGKNPTDRGRKGTKLSVICDRDGVPISSGFYPANVTDGSTTLESVERIACPIKRDKIYWNFLIGDKGYVSKDRVKTLKRDRIKLVTPVKKNMKRKLLTKDKTYLEARYTIEQVFCRLDKFKRLLCRQEASLSSLEAFHKLAMILITFKKI